MRIAGVCSTVVNSTNNKDGILKKERTGFDYPNLRRHVKRASGNTCARTDIGYVDSAHSRWQLRREELAKQRAMEEQSRSQAEAAAVLTAAQQQQQHNNQKQQMPQLGMPLPQGMIMPPHQQMMMMARKASLVIFDICMQQSHLL